MTDTLRRRHAARRPRRARRPPGGPARPAGRRRRRRRTWPAAPTCRADLAALDEVRDLLAGAPDVGPVPGDLVDRLDQALAGAAAEPGASVASTTVVPLRAPGRPRARAACGCCRWPRSSSWSLAGGALGVSALLNAAAAAATTAARRRRTPAATRLGRRGRREHLPGDRHRPRLDAATPCATPAPAARQRHARPDGRRPARVTAGGRRRLEELRQRRAAQPRARRRASRAGSRGGPALADCVTDLAGEPVTPVAVDLAQLRGRAGGRAAAAHPGRPGHGGRLRRAARLPPGRRYLLTSPACHAS